jgi:hypothetical protein
LGAEELARPLKRSAEVFTMMAVALARVESSGCAIT